MPESADKTFLGRGWVFPIQLDESDQIAMAAYEEDIRQAVLIILGMLIHKGGSALSIDFLFTAPTDGMTAGGIFPALFGTVWLVSVALLASVPLGVAAAIYLSEYATPRARAWLKPSLEVLAGIPTIVYGFFALIVVTPILQAVVPVLQDDTEETLAARILTEEHKIYPEAVKLFFEGRLEVRERRVFILE